MSDQPMRVIVDVPSDDGSVTPMQLLVDIQDNSERTAAGTLYNYIGHMLEGGSAELSYGEYVQRIQDMEGYSVSGRVVDGPDWLIGEMLDDVPFVTDIDDLYDVADAGDFDDDPYAAWV